MVAAPQPGGSARGTPGGWGRKTPGPAVLTPSSHLPRALRPGRGQSSLSLPCRRRRRVLSPPAFLGCQPLLPVSAGQSLPKSCCSRTRWPLSPPYPRQLTVSPGPVGVFWTGGPAGGPRPAPPLVPCAPRHPVLGVPVAPGRSRREPPPAGRRCPAQPVPPLRLKIDRCQPCGRAAVARRGASGGGRGAREGA